MAIPKDSKEFNSKKDQKNKSKIKNFDYDSKEFELDDSQKPRTIFEYFKDSSKIVSIAFVISIAITIILRTQLSLFLLNVLMINFLLGAFLLVIAGFGATYNDSPSMQKTSQMIKHSTVRGMNIVPDGSNTGGRVEIKKNPNAKLYFMSAGIIIFTSFANSLSSLISILVLVYGIIPLSIYIYVAKIIPIFNKTSSFPLISKCPQCDTQIDLNDLYCPNCGFDTKNTNTEV